VPHWISLSRGRASHLFGRAAKKMSVAGPDKVAGLVPMSLILHRSMFPTSQR
jgi:hypothetical protein